ncbi:hypothetical protein MMC06_004588 [Schaereria dolodes]|nr:hypothetical protein [Schaereria dolodes]
MPERSSSGVRNLRAMFESKDNSTSPPSRGRSPTGSEGAAVGTSRPISKVRTSFIAVDRNCQAEYQPPARRLSGTGERVLRTDGGVESKLTTLTPESNDNRAQSASRVDDSSNVQALKNTTQPDEGGSETGTNSFELEMQTDSKTRRFDSEVPSSSLDEPLPASKDSIAEPGPEIHPISPGGLGSVLKGSPFEDEQKKLPKPLEGTPLTTEIKATPQASSTKASHNATNTNHKLSSSRSLASAKDNGSQNSDKMDEFSKAKQATKPITLSRKTPSNPSSPRQPPPKASSPRHHHPPLEKTTESSARAVRNLNRDSNVSHGQTNGVTKPRIPSLSSTTHTTKKSGRTSPSMKSRPKSPTRPARLPSVATAPTAASTAKLGGASPPRAASRTGTLSATTTNISRKPSILNKAQAGAHPQGPPGKTSSGVRDKPATSQGNDRPKSRTSVASSKPPEEGFLARMMRPTASSASKVHGKIEPKTPPKRTYVKAKRESLGSDEAKAHRAEESSVQT